MSSTRIISDKLHIYTWNPPWDEFKQLTLNGKIAEFKKFVSLSQEHFKKQNKDADSVCMIIAPDLIFSRSEGLDVCSFNEKIMLDQELATLQPELDFHTLVIAGSMEYATEDESHFKNTTTCLSHNAIQTYDKKKPTSDLKYINNKKLEMERGKKTGIIYFNGRKIGLEICQDHEEAALQTELGINNNVDIHVLISNGQLRRSDRICCVNSTNSGIFIHCELEPKKTTETLCSEKIFASTESFSVRRKPIQNIGINNSIKHRFISSLNNQTKVGAYAKKIENLDLPVLDTTPLDHHISYATGCLPELKEKQSAINISSHAHYELSHARINAVRELVTHPAWALITDNEPAALREFRRLPVSAERKVKPDGITEIEAILNTEHNQEAIRKKLREYAGMKSTSWSWGTRHDITKAVYKVLAVNEFTAEDIYSIIRMLDEKQKLAATPANQPHYTQNTFRKH